MAPAGGSHRASPCVRLCRVQSLAIRIDLPEHLCREAEEVCGGTGTFSGGSMDICDSRAPRRLFSFHRDRDALARPVRCQAKAGGSPPFPSLACGNDPGVLEGSAVSL